MLTMLPRALRCEGEIGTEAIHVVHEADNIGAPFFCRNEKQTCLALHSPEKPLGFFNFWTRKEAHIKLLGDGLYHHSLGRFDVWLSPVEPATIICAENIRGDDYGWRADSPSSVRGLLAAPIIERGRRRAGSAAASPC